MSNSPHPKKPWLTPASATVIAAIILGIFGLLGALNTARSGQQITIGNIVNNAFNFQGATINSNGNFGNSVTQKTVIGGPPVRFAINANALVSSWHKQTGFRVFINGNDTGNQRGGKIFPVRVPPDKNCQIEFLGSPDDITKGEPSNVEFAFSCH